MVIATRMLGVKVNATGSEVAVAPAFMVIDALPLNCSCFMEDAVMALLVPSGETATFTDFMVTADPQVLLENFTRIVSPPIETRTICRKVLLAIAGGVLPDATAYGAQLQVPTHCFMAEV
jgi:hypothetical protein